MTQKSKILNDLIGSKTQKSFSEKHEICQKQISDWIIGRRNISDKKLEELAKKEGFILIIKYTLE